MSELGRENACCEKLVQCESDMRLELALLRRDFETLEGRFEDGLARYVKDSKDLKESVQGLVDAWSTGTGLVRFIKWLSAMAVVLSAIWHIVRDIIRS